MMNKPLIYLATLGPIGRLPAPGTMGSIVAVLSGWMLAQAGFFVLLIASVLAVLIGFAASEIYSRHTGRDDPPEVIIDELAGQWSVLLCIPPNIDNAYLWYGAAFILFRLFDIYKIWPVNLAERLPGGMGIMADDIVAGAMAGNCLLIAQAYIYSGVG